MKVHLRWSGAMGLTSSAGPNEVLMDAKAPLGSEKGMTPKELVVAGLGGCTAMDVIALLKKHKQDMQEFTIEVEVTPSTGKAPQVFTDAKIRFNVRGSVDRKILLESVTLSQTKYCGVSAMLSKAFPIHYEVLLNDEIIGSGQASFVEPAG